MIEREELEKLREWNKLDGFTKAFTECPICHVFHRSDFASHEFKIAQHNRELFKKSRDLLQRAKLYTVVTDDLRLEIDEFFQLVYDS